MSEEESLSQKLTNSVVEHAYDDLIKPSAVVLGEAMAGIFKVIAHYPRLWSVIYDKKHEAAVAHFKSDLDQRVEKIPEENRQLPNPRIAVPVVQALEYGIYDEELRRLFAALLAASMDSQSHVHPEFVDMVKRMDTEEARFLRSGYNDNIGAYPFAPIIFYTVTIDLRSAGMADTLVMTRQPVEKIIKTLPLPENFPMEAESIGDITYHSGVATRVEQKYLVFPKSFKGMNLESITDHLQALGILELKTDIYQGFGVSAHMTQDEEKEIVFSVLDMQYLTEKQFFRKGVEYSSALFRSDDAIEYDLYCDYKILTPTKFGLRFMQLCLE